MDSCYLCEIGKEGLMVTLDGNEVLICADCVLEAIMNHPKLYLWKETKNVA